MPKRFKILIWFLCSFVLLSVLLIVFSVLANCSAIVLNGGKMPVRSELISWEVSDQLHKKMDETTRFKWLCDIFPAKNKEGEIVAMESIGDIARDASGLALLLAFFPIIYLFASSLFGLKERARQRRFTRIAPASSPNL